MGESVAHVPCLQESVSFGRFENDSLCWERWSTFPTNKYLEEVEKCSTPGSVAQKKAYFEAHYKKIAARKAELLDQEKKRETESMDSEGQTPMSSVGNTSEEELDVEKSSAENSVNGLESEDKVSDVQHIDVLSDGADIIHEEDELTKLTSDMNERMDEVNYVADVIEKVNDVASLTSEVTSEYIAESNDGTDMVEEIKDMKPVHNGKPNDSADVIEENKDMQPWPKDNGEDLCLKMEIPEIEKHDKPVLVKEDATATQGSQEKEEFALGKVEEREIVEKETEELAKLVNPKKMQKETVVKKTTNTMNAKKKPASLIPKRSAAPMPKLPMLSTPKSSKPELTKTARSTIRPSVNKANGFTPLTSKKATRPESKRVLPTSLYMSLSLEPAKSDLTSSTTTRKSLIMERMGDKDIVKRAFKAFQNTSQLSPSSLVKSPATNQSTAKKIGQKAPAPDTLQKKREGIIRKANAGNPLTGEQGTRKTSSQPPGLKKNVGVDKKKGKSVPAFGSRSQDQGSKQKEFSKHFEQKAKTKTKDAEKAQLQSKVNVEKAAQIKKPSHSINFKPRLSSSCNQGHGSFR